MFGLGWMELLIIGGVISLVAGPAMLRKLMKGAQDIDKLKSDLTGPRVIERLMRQEPPPDEERDDDR